MTRISRWEAPISHLDSLPEQGDWMDVNGTPHLVTRVKVFWEDKYDEPRVMLHIEPEFETKYWGEFKDESDVREKARELLEENDAV